MLLGPTREGKLNLETLKTSKFHQNSRIALQSNKMPWG